MSMNSPHMSMLERPSHETKKKPFLYLVLWWFPIGRTGLRTLLLGISSLSIFVLRVAQLHLDARVTKSPFETLQKYLFRFNTVQTLTWYLFSAWWFSEVYFWSASDGANLGWISQGR